MSNPVIRSTLAAVAVVGIAAATTGVAQAAPTFGAPGSAAEATSTTSYQMCGTAYQGDWVDDYPLPVDAAAAEGAEITAELFKSGENPEKDPPSETLTTTAAADGTYCVTGTSSLADVIFNGGTVHLTSDDGGQAASDGSSTRVIGLSTFITKRVGGLFGTSALPFNIAF